MSPSRCPPWQPERPGPTRREPRRAQRSYTTRRDTIFKFYATERLARHWRVDPSAAVASLTPVSIQRYQEQFFDPVLGWSFHEETTAFPYAAFDATGARVDSVDGPTGRIAAYGDSFTFGEGAGYDETWPH